ncbi:MAG: hypothetical protein ACKVH9_01210, partial [Rhodobacterales bacterium]
RGINSLLGNSKRKFLYNFFVAIGISAVFLILSYNLAPADDQIIENLNFHKWLSVLPLGVCLMFFQVSAEELLFRGYNNWQFGLKTVGFTWLSHLGSLALCIMMVVWE